MNNDRPAKTKDGVPIGYFDYTYKRWQDGEEIEATIPYIQTSNIPEALRERFLKWMIGQTVPLIDGAPGAVYIWDYERWRRQGIHKTEQGEDWD